MPTVALAYQWRAAVLEAMGPETRVGFYFGEVKARADLPCLIYVINSARYTLPRHVLADMAQSVRTLLIADECHRYGSRENRKIFDFLSHPGYRPALYSVLGLSATPECENSEDVLIPALGRVIYSYPLDRAVRERTVSEFSVSRVRVSLTMEEQQTYDSLTRRITALTRLLEHERPELRGASPGAFFSALRRFAQGAEEGSPEQKLLSLIKQRRLLCCMAQARISCASDVIRALPADSRILVFCEMIRQADQLAAVFQEAGIRRVGRFHSAMTAEARKLTLDRYRDHEIRILICCTALDEGLDVPDTGYAVVVSGNSTLRQRVQRLGRILRRSENKRLAGLYYLYLDRTMEDPVYLESAAGKHPDCNVKYALEERDFSCPAYLALADTLLSLYTRKGASAEQLSSLRKNLMAGHIRNEWLMEPQWIRELISQTTERKERNYLLAMEGIARLRSREAVLSEELFLPAVCCGLTLDEKEENG